jgi:hypothetical protein
MLTTLKKSMVQRFDRILDRIDTGTSGLAVVTGEVFGIGAAIGGTS